MIFAPSCILVDLDDTLYPESSFIESGYKAVSRHLACQLLIDAAAVLNAILYEHHKYGRQQVFDRVVQRFGLAPDVVPELVSVYREHKPELTPYPGAVDALRMLRSMYPVALVTDGLEAVQRRKVEALVLEQEVDLVVFCWELGAPKPSPVAFEHAADQLKVHIATSLIVGDDPFLDVEAAAAAGGRACRVRTGKYGRVEHRSDLSVWADVSHITELPQLLSAISVA